MNIFISMSDLVADAEDLLRALGDSSDPEFQMLRSKVESSIDDMKTNLRQWIKARAASERALTLKLPDAAAIYPWVAATVAGLAAALLIGTMIRFASNRHRYSRPLRS
jgi:ElaB/YqjD/DUF883 family membrane-anchored ribosome-binding protein